MVRKRQSKSGQRGVVAIEFAIGVFAFLMMIFYWMEVSYMGFVSAMVDYAVSESSRVARTTRSEDADYGVIFKHIIDKNDSVWGQFIDADDFVLRTNYFSSVSDIVSCSNSLGTAACTGASATPTSDMPIAIYNVSYPYRPLFATLFFDQIGAVTIRREAITIQEFERGAFLD
ncbi:pilus assembly protein [Sansalvadorimonas sp. 2012CJ34-2]|uniref:Pilus assembly protein n=1 Tax=Parendozoicomonas callyspongiae TaxID=2942213 RepID=A0ABT0PJF5_9GAMM|nr:TadE/TadG family type IV pilus assembly protein [Sansalvadorimonas sp. 2012CJ34-2]MCL6271463.1 pilus assembly protein [Sansalvadorimonas sp. 2012CJ34-2]